MNSTGKAFVIGLATGLIMMAAAVAWCQGPQPSTMPTMVEVHYTYDFLPGVDKNAWAEFAKNFTSIILKQQGLIEYRANRNVLGSPQVLTITVWQSLSDWAKWAQSKEWAEQEAKFRTFVTNIRVEIWGLSPVIPKPLRPGQ